MTKLVAIAALVVSLGATGGVAIAGGPTMRFGLTGAIFDQGAPHETEVGPAIGLGWRSGPFTAEVEWAYLSFFDSDTVNGVQRLGVSLRADVLTRYATHCMFRYACTVATTLWAEAGAGERFGQWLLDARDISPAAPREPEAHVSFGLELDNQIRPMRNGWQLGLRFAVSPRGVGDGTSCRSGSGDCTTSIFTPATTANDKGGYDQSLLVEWMFLFGH